MERKDEGQEAPTVFNQDMLSTMQQSEDRDKSAWKKWCAFDAAKIPEYLLK